MSLGALIIVLGILLLLTGLVILVSASNDDQKKFGATLSGSAVLICIIGFSVFLDQYQESKLENKPKTCTQTTK